MDDLFKFFIAGACIGALLVGIFGVLVPALL